MSGLRGVVGMLIGLRGSGAAARAATLRRLGDGTYLLGALAIQIGVSRWSAGSVYAKQRPTGVSPLMGAAVQMLIAGVVADAGGDGGGRVGRDEF